MKRIRLHRWATQLQPPRNPRLCLQHAPFSQETTRRLPRRQLQERQGQLQHQWQCQRRCAASRRKASSAAAAQVEEDEDAAPIVDQAETSPSSPHQRDEMNAPSHRRAVQSAKLSALHARLSLPAKLPLQTLARCLIDPSVDSRPGYNNEPLALLGSDLLGYYTAEWLMCHYPRLPMPVLFAAQYAYVGSQTLAAMRAEWGVELVAAPGPEVDAGLLQFQRATPGNAMADNETMRLKDMPSVSRLRGASMRKNAQYEYQRRGMGSRIVYDDQFGELQLGLADPDQNPFAGTPISQPASPPASTSGDGTYPMEGIESASTPQPAVPKTTESDPSTTVETASASFIRALAGAVYLHAGTQATKTFHSSHVLSRHLPLHTLFHFAHPTRDLSRLCAREGFEPPVARLLSETGRLSRTPVFIVGVFSGEDKLGEAAGSSLDEGRVRAAAAALRSWYLYSPPGEEVVLPSEAGEKKWKSQVIDIGEIVT